MNARPTAALSSRQFAIGLAFIALAALAIRIAFIVVVSPRVPTLGDASAYHLLAEHLAHGDGYIRPFDNLLLHVQRPTAEYPPLFPLLLALPARLGAHSVEQQRIFMAFVGSGTVALVGCLGRRVASPGAGLIAAALAAVYPMLFLSEATLMAESLYVALVTAMLLLAYRAYDDPKPGRFVALGAVIGCATLTRAEGLLLGIVVTVPLVLLLRGLTARQRAVRIVVGLGVAILVVAPWTIRNAVRFHAFVPVSNNVATLVAGANCDATYGGTELGLWRETFSGNEPAGVTAPRSQAQACFAGFDIADPHFDEAKAASADTRAGLGYARHHLGALPKVATVRVLRTWGLYAPEATGRLRVAGRAGREPGRCGARSCTGSSCRSRSRACASVAAAAAPALAAPRDRGDRDARVGARPTASSGSASRRSRRSWCWPRCPSKRSCGPSGRDERLPHPREPLIRLGPCFGSSGRSSARS